MSAHDLFISYSRRDNTRGQVTALKERIEADYSAFAGDELHRFFHIEEWSGGLRNHIHPAQAEERCGRGEVLVVGMDHGETVLGGGGEFRPAVVSSMCFSHGGGVSANFASF